MLKSALPLKRTDIYNFLKKIPNCFSFRLVSPQVIERNKTYLVSPGDPTILTCPVDGNPSPSVTWYKGNDISGQPLHTGKTWKLCQTKSSHNGLYTCSASNSLGTVTATVILEVGELSSRIEWWGTQRDVYR